MKQYRKERDQKSEGCGTKDEKIHDPQDWQEHYNMDKMKECHKIRNNGNILILSSLLAICSQLYCLRPLFFLGRHLYLSTHYSLMGSQEILSNDHTIKKNNVGTLDGRYGRKY
jgi:hypothetical protein